MILQFVLVSLGLLFLHRADQFVIQIKELVQANFIDQLDDDVAEVVDVLIDGDKRLARIEKLLEEIKRHPGIAVDSASGNELRRIQDELRQLTAAVVHIDQSKITLSQQAVRLLSDNISTTLVEIVQCRGAGRSLENRHDSNHTGVHASNL